MKKILIAFLLFSVGIVPTTSMADEKKDNICYQLTFDYLEEFEEIADRYLDKSKGYPEGKYANDASGYLWHELWLSESKDHVFTLTCSQIKEVCKRAHWSNEDNRCLDFKKDLAELWKKNAKLVGREQCMYKLIKKNLEQHEHLYQLDTVKNGYGYSLDREKIDCFEPEKDVGFCVVSYPISKNNKKEFLGFCYKINMARCDNLNNYGNYGAVSKVGGRYIGDKELLLSDCYER